MLEKPRNLCNLQDSGIKFPTIVSKIPTYSQQDSDPKYQAHYDPMLRETAEDAARSHILGVTQYTYSMERTGSRSFHQ